MNRLTALALFAALAVPLAAHAAPPYVLWECKQKTAWRQGIDPVQVAHLQVHKKSKSASVPYVSVELTGAARPGLPVPSVSTTRERARTRFFIANTELVDLQVSATQATAADGTKGVAATLTLFFPARSPASGGSVYVRDEQMVCVEKNK